jgi:hypothetical protein
MITPDYYRDLPSYYAQSSDVAADLTAAWQTT